jgi:hypothetical protein
MIFSFIKLAENLLRAGDRNPVSSRSFETAQGYGACSMLSGGYFSDLQNFLQLLLFLNL